MGLDSIFPSGNPVLIFIILFWTITLKGIALWRAAREHQRNWFIVILVISSLGILELIYLFRFSKKRLTFAEIRSWFKK